MSVPISQMAAVIKYVAAQRLRGVRRYPLVLMLEPLLRCNLACAGCGKIQHPAAVLRRQLSPAQCEAAARECRAPIVSIPGGEPLLHPRIGEIAERLTRLGRYVYLCTNALTLEESLEKFRPSRRLAFSVHLDGPRAVHDRAVCREGVYDRAIAAMEAARRAGFRVTTNTTLFSDADPESLAAHFDALTELGVEGMMVSPGYAYSKAPDQDNFLSRGRTESLFAKLFASPGAERWRFNQTPLFLEFLQGNFSLECTPWGSPTFNVFGWQRPCYLLDEGYCESFDELMRTTLWENYGQASGNPKCRDCMVHCGYEPSAVAATFGSFRGLAATARLSLRQAWRRLRPPRRGAANRRRAADRL